MDELVFHSLTGKAVESFINNPSHGLLITGQTGSGKYSTAIHIAAKLMQTDPSHITDHPYIKLIQSVDGKAISIESIRELQKFVSLKIPRRSEATSTMQVDRVIVIAQSEAMTTEAQNALLKILEEPPIGTVLLLTATADELLLPTTLSRLRVLRITPPGPEAVLRYFASRGYDEATVRKHLPISGSLPGMIAALLANDTEHPLIIAATHARGILGSKTYERLVLVDGLSKQKSLTIDILFVLGRMSRLALQKTTDRAAIERWINISSAVFVAERQYSRNVQSKLILTNLFLAF